MTKYARITGKVFGSSATATGNDPQIGQFGSALAGTYNGTTDVATIQSLPAWQNGFIGAVTPTTQFPPLPEMTGFGKVLSQQICYLLQQGIAEYDSGTTYYIGNWVSYNSSLYVAKVDNFSNQLPTNTTYWDKFTGGSSRNLGEYVTSSLPLTDTTLHLADGALLTQTDYPELYSYISSIYSETYSWSELHRIHITEADWRALAYGDNKFVALNYMLDESIGDRGWVAVKTDGNNSWESYHYTNLWSYGWYSAIYDGTQFIALGKGGDFNNYITTSTNPASTWTNPQQITALGTKTWRLAFDGTNIIALSLDGYISTSADGSTWTTPTQNVNLGNNNWTGIAYNGAKFVAIGLNGYISTSTDGTTWTNATQVSNLGNNKWRGIAYGDNKFKAIGNDGYVSTSTDGTTWTLAVADNVLGDNDWLNIAYGNNEFITIGNEYYSESIIIPSAPFVTEANWQTAYTTYGECGKYVFNSGANTIRIPAVNSYFTNTVNPQILGDLTPASLPNIKGSGILNDDTSFCSGALYDSGSVSTTNSEPGGSSSKLVKFDASRSNSIYSDTATTVNTQSVKQLVYIVVKK